MCHTMISELKRLYECDNQFKSMSLEPQNLRFILCQSLCENYQIHLLECNVLSLRSVDSRHKG